MAPGETYTNISTVAQDLFNSQGHHYESAAFLAPTRQPWGPGTYTILVQVQSRQPMMTLTVTTTANNVRPGSVAWALGEATLVVWSEGMNVEQQMGDVALHTCSCGLQKGPTEHGTACLELIFLLYSFIIANHVHTRQHE